MRRRGALLLALALSLALLCGCGAQPETAAPAPPPATEAPTADAPASPEAEAAPEPGAEPANPEGVLPDGVYSVRFDSDSSMFHVNEACDGRGTLTVKDGEMTLHISLASKKITLLYPGLREDAKKEGAAVLEPTLDTVTYANGDTDEVYGFDVPVPYLDETFDLALLGSKGNWYDHKVSVSDPVEITG